MKKIKILLIAFLLVLSFTNCIYASDSENSITKTGKGFINLGESKVNEYDGKNATKEIENMAGLLKGIGIFVAVGVGMILGIKFLLSTAEGKAEISKLLQPYIIGIAIVVGAVVIWRAAIELLDVF